MDGIKSRITINIFYRTNKIIPNTFFVKIIFITKTREEKKNKGRNITEEKKWEEGKKEEKGQPPSIKPVGDLTIARRVPYLLCYIRHYNKRLEIYVTYKPACMNSLIQTDTGRDIVAFAMKQIATKTIRFDHFL